jgi:aspartate aminotransferase
MSLKLAPRLAAVKPSATLALNARAKALAAKGLDVISFAAGEPDFDTPPHVKKAGMEAIESGFTKYTATAGVPELRAAIAQKLKRENALEFSADQILVSVGAKHALYNLFQALLGDGDQVVVFAPYWVTYPDMVRLAGGEPVIVETKEENGYAPEPAALEKALGPKVRAVILNSPSNPTGAVLPDATLRGIGEVLRGHQCLVVTDDIYERFLYVDRPFHNLANVAPDLKERTVVVNGWSKSFSMTGWRLGYAAGPKELIAGMQMIQDQSTSNASSMVQKAGLAALNGPLDDVFKMVAEFRVRRDLIVAGLDAIPGIRCRTPEGAFYAFPNVQGLLERKYKGERVATSLRLSEILLDDFHVAAVPGQPFGAEGYLRLSFATSREAIQKGLERLPKLVSELT